MLGRHGVNGDDQNVSRRQPLEDDRKTVFKEVDSLKTELSLCLSLCLQEKTDEKTITSHIDCTIADQVAPKEHRTIEG